MISGVSKVIVPVDDQERAKQFWTERIGFETVRDERYGDERWIEVSPPDGAPLLVLSPRPAGDPRREVPAELPHSPVFFDCADIEATHRELRERGVRFPTPPTRQHFGWWSLFEDPDGTRYALGQWDTTPAAFAAPPPHPELKRVEPLLGTWRTERHTQESVMGPGVPVRSIETFYWLDGGYFLVSTYETTFGREPTQTGVNYWSYDEDARRFRIIFFSNNGPFREDGNRYEGVVADGRLTFEGPARFQYELADDGAIAVNPNGTLSVAWWLRDENGNWAPWMHNTFTRVR
jgi:predicted enzyme related to lactoylglutathione lyase